MKKIFLMTLMSLSLFSTWANPTSQLDELVKAEQFAQSIESNIALKLFSWLLLSVGISTTNRGIIDLYYNEEFKRMNNQHIQVHPFKQTPMLKKYAGNPFKDQEIFKQDC